MKALSLSVVLFLLIVPVAAIAAAQDSVPPNLPGSSLMIPWSDFKEILEKLDAQGGGTPEPEPPVDGMIASATYNAVVGEHSVFVNIEATIVVLKKSGWAVIPVMRTGAPVAEATLDGKPTALSSNQGQLQLAVNEPGAHTLRLKLALPLTKNSGPEGFSLPTVAAQVQKLSVKIDKPELEVKTDVGGRLISTSSGGATTASGSFSPSDPVRVTWARSVPKAQKAEARVSAQVRTLLTLGEGLGVYTTIVDYDIQHKPVTEFEMLLPEDVTVADVSTDGMVDWRVDKVEGGQRLKVSIAFEAIGRHPVAVTYEKALPEGDSTEMATADLKVENVVHELGYLAVAVRSNVQVSPKDGSLQNLSSIDANELPPDLRGRGDQKVLFGFTYLKHPAKVVFEVQRHKDASVLTCEVEHAAYRIMWTDRGKQVIEATYRIANRNLQYLSLTLPPDTDLWGVFRDGQPVKSAEKDGQVLLPIFQGGLNTRFTITVLAYRKAGGFGLPMGRKAIELPLLDVGAQKVDLELYLPADRFRFFGYGGKLRPGQQIVPVTSSIVTLEGNVGGKAAGASQAGGDDGLFWEKDNFAQDEATIDRNLQYRDERSHIQSKIANIPVATANPGYANAMTRGALPVRFDVAWQGHPYRFSTSIVDPGEKMNVTFLFSRRIRSSMVGLAVFLLALVFGYLIAWIVVAKKESSLKPPSRPAVWLGADVVLLGLLAVMHGSSRFTLIFGAIVGVLGLLIRTAIVMNRASKHTPVATPVEPSIEEGGDE
jgi:hypothetical protein